MYLINKNEYFNWIDSNIYLTKCQKNILKHFRINLGKIYKDRKSNNQFYTYIVNAYKSENIMLTAKMVQLLQKFINYKDSIKLISEIKKNKLSDKEIYVKMEEIRSKPKSEIIKRNTKDIFNICSSWKYIFEDLSMVVGDFLQDNNVKKIKYLDVGCGNGNKTIAFSKNIGIQKENIYGTDIENWGPYDVVQHSHHDFNFSYIKKDGTLDYPDNSFDIITCILMLHHVEKLDFLLGEINRVLKPSGILIIIEHDCHDDYDKMILEILHGAYEYLVDKNENNQNNENNQIESYSSYHNWAEWDFIFDKNNFNYLKGNYIFINIEHSTRFDNIYYTIYKKK